MNITRAVVYTRVSTQGQADEGVSLEVQLDLARKFCEARGWVLAETYTDVMSGRNDRRPQLRRLEADAKGRRFDVVIVYKIDRLARSAATFYKYASLLQERGIQLKSLTEDFDTASIEGKVLTGVLAIFAEIFSDQLSQRVRGAMAQIATKGQWLTGARSPIGYQLVKKEGVDPRLEIDEAEAGVVHEIFESFLSCRTLRSTCDALYTKGIRTRSGSNFQSETLKYLLRNPVYVGASAWGKYRGSRGGKRARILTDPSTWVVTEGTHDPIIERRIWDEVQRILDENKSKAPRNLYSTRTYAWNGLLKCHGERSDGGVCGFAMNNRIRRYGNGKSIREYYCNAFMSSGKAVCPNFGRVTDKFLDWEVTPRLDELLRKVGIEDQAKRAASKKKPPRQTDTSRRIASLEARRDREKELFRGGFSTFDEMAASIKKIEQELKDLAANSAAPAPTSSLPLNLLDVWDRLEPSEQNDMLRSIIAWCEVDRQTMRVILKRFDHPEWPEILEIPIVSTRWHPNNRR